MVEDLGGYMLSYIAHIYKVIVVAARIVSYLPQTLGFEHSCKD